MRVTQNIGERTVLTDKFDNNLLKFQFNTYLC